MAEDLEAPIDSLPFLESYHKSARKVERLSQTIKQASWGFGCLAVAFFAFAFLSLLSHTATQSKAAVNHRL